MTPVLLSGLPASDYIESFCARPPTPQKSETGFHTPPWLKEKIATDTFTPSPAPVVNIISEPMGGGFLYTTGAGAENSAAKFSKESVPLLYKIGLPKNRILSCVHLFRCFVEFHRCFLPFKACFFTTMFPSSLALQ